MLLQVRANQSCKQLTIFFKKKKKGTADIFDEFHIKHRSIGDEVIYSL